jgi:hypothetical protein
MGPDKAVIFFSEITQKCNDCPIDIDKHSWKKSIVIPYIHLTMVDEITGKLIYQIPY